MKIYAFHLLNDYSGSPKVLSQVLRGLAKEGHKVCLNTSTNTQGFLSNLEGVEYISNRYTFKVNKIMRLFYLVFSQVYSFVKLWFRLNRDDIVYVNTILPFGAAVLGRLKRCKVVYHIHETTIRPYWLKKFLFSVVSFTADHLIYVSKYLKDKEPLPIASSVVSNSLEASYLFQQEVKVKALGDRILMVCSLKEYKGVNEFVELASGLQQFQFELVVNASPQDIERFFCNQILPSNLKIYPTQADVKAFYRRASLVLNLSRTDQWIETFGLTAIEAMAFANPVIVPPVGGISELVEEGITGFKVDSRNLDELIEKIRMIMLNPSLYQSLSIQAKLHASRFSENRQIRAIRQVLSHLPQGRRTFQKSNTFPFFGK